MGSAIKNYRKTTDLGTLLLCFLLSCVSVLTLVSVAQYGGLALGGGMGNWRLVFTQVLATVLGLAGAVVFSLIGPTWLTRYWPVHMAICWGLVLLTFVPGFGYGPAGTGSQSWIALPMGMSFQPTELAKLSFIITFAVHLEWAGSRVNKPKVLFPLLAHLAGAPLLVHLQGDDGTALVFWAIGGIMLIAAGLNRWVVAACAAVTAVAAPFVWQYVLSAYQRQRILGLLNPEAYADGIMYQQLRGRMAVGSGQLFGRGLFQPGHSFVPRPENDFIFSYFAESCGFIGCVVLLALLFGLLAKTLLAAFRAPSRVGTYICVGIFAMLLFQIVVNIGMNLMLLPVMGITLPFMSAGGTSMAVLYLAIGILLGVRRQSAPPGLPTAEAPQISKLEGISP